MWSNFTNAFCAINTHSVHFLQLRAFCIFRCKPDRVPIYYVNFQISSETAKISVDSLFFFFFFWRSFPRLLWFQWWITNFALVQRNDNMLVIFRRSVIQRWLMWIIKDTFHRLERKIGLLSLYTGLFCWCLTGSFVKISKQWPKKKEFWNYTGLLQ